MKYHWSTFGYHTAQHTKTNTFELVDDKNNEANFQNILNYFFKNIQFNKRLYGFKIIPFHLKFFESLKLASLI